MKKAKLFLLLISLLAVSAPRDSYGFSIHKPATNSDQYGALKNLTVTDLVKLSAKEFSELTGKQMNTWDKLSFKIAKLQMKHDLKKNPALQLNDYYPRNKAPKSLRIVYWVVIGLLLLFLVFALLVGKFE